MTSLMMGSKPPWWIPMPLLRSGSIIVIWGSCWSSSLRVWIALLNILSIESFSSS